METNEQIHRKEEKLRTRDENAAVDFYKQLPAKGYYLVILRALRHTFYCFAGSLYFSTTNLSSPRLK
jgi:hypothetical protein